MPIDRLETAQQISARVRRLATVMTQAADFLEDTLAAPNARANDVLTFATSVGGASVMLAEIANDLMQLAPRYEETP